MVGSNTLQKQKIEISIRNTTQGSLPLTRPKIKNLIKKIFECLNESGGWSIDILFIAKGEILRLNKKYLKHAYPTDVITFKYKDKSADIAISFDALTQNAKIYKSSLKKELALYILHAILHLFGYDDNSPLAAKRMHAKEEEILRRIIR